eukprot:TRINITY_DN9701_c0_g1_i1.p1 TRINITY_DN9701_c0_g1~~TRINITY_DN9701_c0_g1_i1.p1  ORF type:complete len:417 (+),score=99.60 TRINITY_DN9701_c0_g1_i1:43-1293(+)
MASQCIKVSKAEDLKFEKCLGRGYFGEVWRARLHQDGSLFAVKKVRLQLVIENKLMDQLGREIKILYSLQHPRIVRLHFDFKDAKHMYLGMEFASGGSLYDKLNTAGKFPCARAARYFRETCEALDYLHHLPEKVIHRDIKPENILLDAQDSVKLADFGWANRMQAGKRETFCGTLDYLPPEMIMGTGHDESVDMWNMGVLLYELTTGQSPFGSQSKETTCKLILNVDLRFPSQLDADVQELISALCRKKPSERLDVRRAMSHRCITRLLGPLTPIAPAGGNEESATASSAALSSSKGVDPDALEGRPSVLARKLHTEVERMHGEKEQLLAALKRLEGSFLQGSEDLRAIEEDLMKQHAKRLETEEECRRLAAACEARDREIEEAKRGLRRKSIQSDGRRKSWLQSFRTRSDSGTN